jgi:hypothetical protein
MFNDREFFLKYLSTPNCTNRTDGNSPFFEHEENYPRLPTAGRNVFLSQDRCTDKSNHSVRPTNIFSGKSGNSEGLCSNCENRAKCAIRSQEGGVWHCEEYR